MFQEAQFHLNWIDFNQFGFFKYLIKIKFLFFTLCFPSLSATWNQGYFMRNRKIKELMTDKPCIIEPDSTLQEAARMMVDLDCGFLPVCRQDDVIGIITDRDIVIRAISRGLDPTKEKVINHMTHECYACREDDYLEDAAEKMREHKVSRLIVRNAKAQLSGDLSLRGIFRRNSDTKEVANVVKHAIRQEVA